MSDWILVTGGTGYIGSHTCVELMQAGREVCIVDSLVNSRASVAARIGRLAGRGVELQIGDVRDRAFLDRVFSNRRYAAVIHFAGFKAVRLRYFNPVGAHQSGLLGEEPAGIPNNLMPYVSQVAVGRLKELAVFGNDYPTPDGTGVRDYVHVVDLARAHVSALAALPRLPGATRVNLGTGRPIPYRIEPRRPGDVAASYTDPSLALRLLGWRAERGLDDMCRDAWRWQQWSAAHASEL